MPDYKSFVFSLKESVNFLIQIIIPRQKKERIVFLFFFLVFVLMSIVAYYDNNFAVSRTNEIIGYDIGVWFHILSRKLALLPYFMAERHPYATMLLSPIIIIGSVLKDLSGDLGLHIIFIMLVFSAIMSLSLTVLYKYCVNLLKLSALRSFILTLLCSLFSQILLLSILPESYPISMLLLLLMVYMTTENILMKKKIPFGANVITQFILTGITITNFLKYVVAQFFQTGTIKKHLRLVFFSGIVCLITIILSIAITQLIAVNFMGEYWSEFNSFGFITRDNINLFQDPLCESIFFHDYSTFYFVEIGRIGETMIYNDIYPEYISLLFYSLIVLSVILNIRKKSVLLLLSFILVDVLIHVIFGFGYQEMHIYSLHWLFIFPLLIGWLYKTLKYEKVKMLLDVLLLTTIIGLGIHNIPRIYDFIINF